MEKVLLHICCAPCGAHVVTELKKEYAVSLFDYNPNIFPIKEKQKRSKEVEKLASLYNVPLIAGEYDHQNWLKAIKGYELDPEGGARCGLCFRYRLEQTALKAKKLGFNFFATTLGISPYKNIKLINQLGQELAEKYNLTFLARDWKKKGGYQHSVELSKKFGFYRQNYCGCEFSIRNKI